MIAVETAIRRVSFAEARNSSAEALAAIAQHRTERDHAVSEAGSKGGSGAEHRTASSFAARARKAHKVDKTA
ncbi:MAG: hypothetical protein ABI398_04765 [Devosia sp.]